MRQVARFHSNLSKVNREPLFELAQVAEARSLIFFALSLEAPSHAWSHSHQPVCLNALEALSLYVGDADIHLLSALKSEVPTGYQNDVSLSFPFGPACVKIQRMFH